jgi:hypothetical protein
MPMYKKSDEQSPDAGTKIQSDALAVEWAGKKDERKTRLRTAPKWPRSQWAGLVVRLRG